MSEVPRSKEGNTMRWSWLPVLGAVAGVLLGVGLIVVDAGWDPEAAGLAVYAALFGGVLGLAVGIAGVAIAAVLRRFTRWGACSVTILSGAIVAAALLVPVVIDAVRFDRPLSGFGLLVAAVGGLGTALVIGLSPRTRDVTGAGG